MQRCRLVVLWGALVLGSGGACGRGSQGEAGEARPAAGAEAGGAEAPAADGAGAGSAEATAEDATKAAAPAEATPEEAPAEAEAEAPAPAGDSTLRVVAVREGLIDLQQSGDAALVLIEREPLVLEGDVPTRVPGGSVGLGFDVSLLPTEVSALAAHGDPRTPGGAWLTIIRDYEREATEYTVYERLARRWKPVELSKGVLLAHYPAYVERGGAVFGLRRWTIEPGSADHGYESSAAERAVWRRAERTLARSRPAWVRLGGAEVEAPAMPKGLSPELGVGTDDGAVHALASRLVDEELEHVLLVWPQGSNTAEVVAVPGATKVYDPHLARSGAWALLAGSAEGGSYLAVGRGTAWSRVDVTLPGRSPDITSRVLGAARTPTGELWIVMGDVYGHDTEPSPVWRKPVDGDWQPVPLPSVVDRFPTGKGWVHPFTYSESGTWEEIEREPLRPDAGARGLGLVWAQGAVWVSVELDQAYSSDNLMDGGIYRSALLTTRPGTGPVTTLPSALDLQVERYNTKVAAAKKPECDELSFVLGPAPAEAEPATVVEALMAARPSEGEEQLDVLYVGREGGKEVLVGMGHMDEGAAVLLAKALGEAAGQAVTPDCRIIELIRMLRHT